MFEVNVQVRLDAKNVEGQEAVAEPVVEEYAFNFYNSELRLDKKLKKKYRQ